MTKHFQDEIDCRIAAALESVEVPSDLSRKIMNRLQQAALQDSAACNPTDAQGSELLVASAEFSKAESHNAEISKAESHNTELLANAVGHSVVGYSAAEQSTYVTPGPASEAVEIAGRYRANAQAYPKLFSRRGWLAAAVAAGAGGMLLGYRQLTQPLSQPWLTESSLGLLEQLESSSVAWQAIEREQPEVALLRDAGFFRQVRNVGLVGSCTLRPPRNIEQVTAYNLGPDARGGTLVLLVMIVERGVQGLTHSFKDLPQKRSDAPALAAMQSGNHLFVLAGRGSLSKYILRGQTT